MLATFNSTWDWTAVGTLTLAIVTGVSLAFGWGSLKQTQRQIELGQEQLEQTQREIELSRTEVEEAHRPVIVPVVSKRLMDLVSDGSGEARPRALGNTKLVVPIENIGSGPALNIEASLDVLSETDEPSGKPARARVAGLGVGKFEPLILPYGTITVLPFALTVEYDDVAGKGWKTNCIFTGDRYEGVRITAHTREHRELSDMVKPVLPADS